MSNTIRIGTTALACVLIATMGLRAQDWPQFRGPNRDNKVEGFKAPATWPKELTQKWTAPDIGIGASSPVLAGEKVYVFGRIGEEEVTTCLDAANGKQVWQDRYEAVAITNAGKIPPGPGTRSTPAVAEGKVCTLGVGGVVSCLDAATGKVVWREDTKSKPDFYTSSSPLIADGKCIVYAEALTAFDLTNGKHQWDWRDGKAPYGSPVLMTVDGTKQVVTCAFGSIVGVGFNDGKLLWKHEFGGKAYQGQYMTPIIDGRTVIFSAPAGKKGGGMSGTIALKIEKQGEKFTATKEWQIKDTPYQYNTPVLRDGRIFGLSTGRTFFCMDAGSGKVLWTDTTKRGEAGAVLSAGHVMLALTGDSELVAFEPGDKAYKELAHYKVSATTGLPYPIVSGNRVIVKSKDSLTMWTLD
jgi:outer membrane protein assembly factor BamB